MLHLLATAPPDSASVATWQRWSAEACGSTDDLAAAVKEALQDAPRLLARVRYLCTIAPAPRVYAAVLRAVEN